MDAQILDSTGKIKLFWEPKTCTVLRRGRSWLGCAFSPTFASRWKTDGAMPYIAARGTTQDLQACFGGIGWRASKGPQPVCTWQLGMDNDEGVGAQQL